jgi:hypothetical protein
MPWFVVDYGGPGFGRVPFVGMEFFTVSLFVHSTNMQKSKPTVFIFHIVILFRIVIIPIHKHHWDWRKIALYATGMR